MQNHIEQAESMSLGYTTLSALNLRATAIESDMASHQPDNHSSHLTQDMHFQVDAAVIPVSGSNELNRTSRNAPNSFSGRSVKSQDEGPLVGALDDNRQALGPKHSVILYDSQLERGKSSRIDNLLNDSPISLLNVQKGHNDSKGKAMTLNMKVEETSQALASEVYNTSNPRSLDEIHSMIKNGILNIFISRGTGKRGSADASLTEPAGSKRRLVTCEVCSKKMFRECDLKYKSSLRSLVRSAKRNDRKHQKRHTRPYACTFKACFKAFGSKNDWKRHENTQHHQVEAWRCHEPSPNRIKQCAKVFYRREPFQSHLKDGHDIKDEDYIREQLKRHQIGRNGQTGFWCGFCQKIVKLTKQGLEAWDERFNHIDDNHFKKGCRIQQWYELDRDIPNGLLRNEHVLDSGFPSVEPYPSDSYESDDNEPSNSSSSTPVNSPHAFPAQESAPRRNEQGGSKGKGSGRGRGSAGETTWICVSTSPVVPSASIGVSAYRW